MISADIESLWHEHHSAITRYVQRRVSQAESAEDIVQLVFTRAWAAMCSGKGYTDHARGWLYRIARNLIIDYYRAQDRVLGGVELDALWADNADGTSGGMAAELVTSAELGPHALVERVITQERVQQAVNHLPGKQSTVVALRLEGREYDEIADALNTTYGAAKAYQTRAYVYLRLWLADLAEDAA